MTRHRLRESVMAGGLGLSLVGAAAVVTCGGSHGVAIDPCRLGWAFLKAGLALLAIGLALSAIVRAVDA